MNSTDDWAAATRALVNLGRQPLATGLWLQLPGAVAEERAMWATVSRLAARPFDEKTAEADRFRRQPDAVHSNADGGPAPFAAPAAEPSESP